MKTFLVALALCSVSLALPVRAASMPESQKIDDLLQQDWQKNNLKPNPPAPDDVLVRRLYLDITGRIPTIGETQDFVKSGDPQKRAKLIDKLLASDGYTSNMFNYWADILRLTDNVKGKVTAMAYAEYVKRCLKENKPYDQFVRDLLTTDGGVWDSGSIGFYMRDENKLDHLAYTTQVFLGTSIVCAQCHNHPFDKWSQMDYYGMAAFTYGMDTKGYGDGLNFGKRKGQKEIALSTNEAIKSMTKQERQKYMKEHQEEFKKIKAEEAATQKDLAKVRDVMKDVMKPLRYTSIHESEKLPALPHDYKYGDGKPGQTIQPKTIFGHDAVPATGETRLDAFAKWMTSPENPRFTMVIANRMWKKAFGLGLIEPVDEITDSTVASNPQLMDYLTQLMTDKQYSLKSMLRVLYNTAAYQRMASSTEVPLGDTYHFTGPTLRRMSAEQIWDSMVTLSKGNTDAATSEENEHLHQYLGDLKLLMDTMHDKGAAGMIEIAKRGADQREANQKRLEDLRQEAKAAKDKGGSNAKELADEANRLRKNSSNDMLVAILGDDRARELKQGYNMKKVNKVEVVDRKALQALSKEARKEAIAAASNFNISTRASELPSPERAGHFLRTFGQSDRELISNQSDDASVPQALALLNGPAADALAGPLSNLHQELNKASSPAEKMDMLYVAFLSRHPSRDERMVLDQVIHDRGDKALADVTHALLTGSQFLFIQ